jgi:Ferritin-like domain
MNNEIGNTIRRRSFLRRAGIAAAALPAVGALKAEESATQPTRGDIAILKLLTAAEIIESDLWLQYSELGGVQDQEVSGENGGNELYTGALQILDGDMAQYIHDNTDDEKSHARFLNNYLMSKGEAPVSLEQFRRLPGSQAKGANKDARRLTNLTQLTMDTTFWSRYRSITNPDFDPGAKFAQAVPSLAEGQHTAIPRSDDDTHGSFLSSDNSKSITPFLQAIAFTAGFHFAFIEQGGTSLYATLAQKVSSLEVLRILLSIGGSEIMHFQTWQDKAGNALPLTNVVDPKTKVTVSFTDLTMAKGETSPESLNGDTLQANLIMPEPTHFLNPALGPVAIIRPSSTTNSGAVAAIKSFQDDGLFIGQREDFLDFVFDLAEQADAAYRQVS